MTGKPPTMVAHMLGGPRCGETWKVGAFTKEAEAVWPPAQLHDGDYLLMGIPPPWLVLLPDPQKGTPYVWRGLAYGAPA